MGELLVSCVRDLWLRGQQICMRELLPWLGGLQLCVRELLPWVSCLRELLYMQELRRVPCVRGLVPCM